MLKQGNSVTRFGFDAQLKVTSRKVLSSTGMIQLTGSVQMHLMGSAGPIAIYGFKNDRTGQWGIDGTELRRGSGTDLPFEESAVLRLLNDNLDEYAEGFRQ